MEGFANKMLTIHSQPGTGEHSDAKHQVQLLLHIFRSHILRIEEAVTFYTIKTKLRKQ